MKFELGLDKPDPARARVSAMTIGLSDVAGGLVPLSPYFVVRSMGSALADGDRRALAAAAAFGIAKLIS